MITHAIRDRSRERDAARLESGLRLIEVHKLRSRQATNVRDIDVSRTFGTWRSWLEDSGIPETTAREHKILAM